MSLNSTVADLFANLAALMELKGENTFKVIAFAKVSRIIRETGATGIKDMGKVMKSLAPLTAGRADGKTVSDIVRQHLA